MEEDRSDDGDGDNESIDRASLFGDNCLCTLQCQNLGFETDSQEKQRSKCGHDFVPVNHTDGSWEDAVGSLRDGRMTGHWTRSLNRRPECDKEMEITQTFEDGG